MPKSLCVIVLILFFSFSFSQNSIVLQGKVVDDQTQLPIESVTVYLSKAKDSSVVDYTITDKLGKFTFKTKKITTPVYLKMSYISYEDYKVDLSSVESNKDFGIIKLKASSTNLNEVQIKREIPPIRIKKDTLEFNASSFKVRPDANVETLLKQLPGVEIDSDGKITVNGKEVNQILVNGKPFFDKDGKVALQNLPSDIINKVQVTDTKTTKEEKTGQEASSNNASINLTIDEDKNKGFFGKFMGGYGSNKRYESSVLINYFKDKRKVSVLASSNNINSIGFSMDEVFDNMGGGRNRNVWFNDNGTFGINGRNFGSGKGITLSNLVGVNYSDEWSEKTETSASYFYSSANTKNDNRTQVVNFLPTGNFTTDSKSKTNEDRYVHNVTSEFEFKIDSTASVTIEPNFTKSYNKNSVVSSQSSFDAADALLNESNTNSLYENNANTFKNTLSFSKSFKRKGKYLSLVFENNNSVAKEDEYNNSTTIFYQNAQPDDRRDQINFSKNTKNYYLTELEFSQPITDSLQINLGLEYQYDKNTDNRDSFDFDLISQSYSQANDLLTNVFSATEKTIVPSTGIQISKKKYNFNFNAGTSIINFDASVNYRSAQTNYNKNYLLPYINAYGNYRFTKTRNIWINYNYTYDLPSARQVLPVEDLANPLNTIIGNPTVDLNKHHWINFSFRDFDYATRSGYGLYSGANLYDNQVVSSTTFDQNRKRTTTYQNASGTYNGWMGVYWNKSFKKEAHKFRFETRVGTNFGLSKGFTDGQNYEAKSKSITPRLNFTYDYGELLTINPSYSYTFSKTDYTNYVIESASNFIHRINIQLTSYWPKNWVFGNDFGYTYNSNIASGFKKDFYLWNTSLSYGFFEKKLMAKVKVYDILNQNQNATRSISATSIRDEENVVLKRYVMFSLTYKLEKFAGKEKKRTGGMMFW